MIETEDGEAAPDPMSCPRTKVDPSRRANPQTATMVADDSEVWTCRLMGENSGHRWPRWGDIDAADGLSRST